MKFNFKYMLGIAIVSILFFLGYLFIFNFVDQYEIGITRNIFTGQIDVQHAGIHFTSPFIQEIAIDTRPHRVCITSSSKIAFNCKLVAFNPIYTQEFIKTEGFGYYWWNNRFSFNFGYKEEYRGFVDVLRGYAFSMQKYPFVEEVQSN